MTSMTPEPVVPESKTDKEKESREAALRKAYTLATAELRTANQKQFNDLYKAHAKELGYDWEPKKTAEDRAREQVAEILEKFPNLAEEVAKTVVVNTTFTS